MEREHPTGPEDVASYVAALAGTPAVVATPVLRSASGWRHTQPMQIHEADLAWRTPRELEKIGDQAAAIALRLCSFGDLKIVLPWLRTARGALR